MGIKEKITIVLGFIITLTVMGIGIYGMVSNKNLETNKNKIVTLEEIVETFLNSGTIKSYEEYGVPVTATIDNQSIIVNFEEEQYQLNLEGEILSATIDKEREFSGTLMFAAIVDSIGQLHGYSEGETYLTLNSEEIKTYTLDKGFEIADDGNAVTIKTNINKKLELLDLANIYITTDDLISYADFIKDDGCAQRSKGNVIFHKCGYGDEATITIGEKDNLTDNAYNSLLSVIEVIYGEEESTWFTSEFPILENKVSGRYNLTVNPELDDMLTTVFNDPNYKIVQLIIDKSI